jgi:hypothetical protein
MSETGTVPLLPSQSARRRADLGVHAWFIGAALLAGVAAVGLGAFAAVAVAGIAVTVLTALRPVTAVYVYLATLPFLAGIDRDRLLPLVRPNEALLVLLLVGVVTGAYLRFVRGDEIRLRLSPFDVALGVFVLLSTLWPVTWMLLRGAVPGGAELAALLPVCKLIGLLILVRVTVRYEDELLRLGRVIIWPAAVVAVIAVLQTVGFPPVVTLLNTYWRPLGSDPTGVTERGSTTLASSIATGDYVVLALALLIALSVRGLVARRELQVVGLILLSGTLAAGQFSTWASASIVGAGLLHLHTQLRRYAVRLIPVLGVAILIGLPAFWARLAEFGDGYGVPRSWLGRWDNLVSFYLPALGKFGWLLGISPNSVLQAPETWREVIYLEYGYLQLLWVGGVPLLAAFVWLSVELLRHARRAALRPDAAGAYASALWAAWWMVLLLSVIDIHLVLRGAGELFFTFIAIISGRIHDR